MTPLLVALVIEDLPVGLDLVLGKPIRAQLETRLVNRDLSSTEPDHLALNTNQERLRRPPHVKILTSSPRNPSNCHSMGHSQMSLILPKDPLTKLNSFKLAQPLIRFLIFRLDALLLDLPLPHLNRSNRRPLRYHSLHHIITGIQLGKLFLFFFFSI